METKLNFQNKHNFSASWQHYHNSLKSYYGESVYNGWFASLKLVVEESSSLTFSVKSRFIKEWIMVNYYDDLVDIAKKYKADLYKLDIIVNSTEVTEEQNSEVQFKLKEQNVNDNNDVFSAKLDPRANFTNFIVGEENRVGFAALQSMISNNMYVNHINSVYIHSKVGLGKTHLLSAVAHELNKTDQKYIFISSERYVYHYSKAVANQDLMSFKERLYNIDYFLLDDLQFIQGKTGTQQELVNLVSFLVANNKKLIFTGDRKINDYKNLDIKLKSLLSGGMVAALSNAARDLREKIIRHKIIINKFSLPEKIINFLVEQSFFNVREIEGAINKIIIHQNILGEEVTINNIADIVKDFVVKTNYAEINPENIIKILSNHYKISVHEIKSKKRNKEIVYIRDIAIYLCKILTKLSLVEIGKVFARDHATILHSYRKTEKLMRTDLIIKLEIEKITEMMHNK